MKTGRISTVPGEKPGQRLINPEVADREWEANTEALKRKKDFAAEMGLAKPSKPSPPPPPKAPPKPAPAPQKERLEELQRAEVEQDRQEAGEPEQQQGQKGPSFAQSRAFREAYQARLAKLAYEEKAGKLVDADKVKVEAFKVGRIVRDAILAVADRISFKVAAETDERKVNLMLKAELTAAMEELTLAGKRG